MARLSVLFFEEGGRFTAGDFEGDGGGRLVPGGETEFAKDSSFGYVSSDLKDWVEEKSGGKVKREDVVSVSLRSFGSIGLGKLWTSCDGGGAFGKVVVNAVSYEDLKVFVIALLEALGRESIFCSGRRLLLLRFWEEWRTGLCWRERFVWECEEARSGGWWLWGLMCKRRQGSWRCSGKGKGFVFWNFRSRVSGMRKNGGGKEAGSEGSRRADGGGGVSVVIYTGRQVRTAESGKREDNLALSVRISEAVTELVGRMPVTPRFLVAKGGITSSDIGTKALGVKKAFCSGADSRRGCRSG